MMEDQWFRCQLFTLMRMGKNVTEISLEDKKWLLAETEEEELAKEIQSLQNSCFLRKKRRKIDSGAEKIRIESKEIARGIMYLH